MRKIRVERVKQVSQYRHMPQLSLDTQFGTLTVLASDGAVTGLLWGRRAPEPDAVTQAAVQQLAAYDAGDLEEFDLPLRYSGSDLQQAVCAAMMDIPFGDTCTYGEIAKSVGASAQAVGQACGGNAIPVIVPCHRVMGAGGKLVGYSGEGGVETKVKLLRHEGAAGFLI